MYLFFFHLYLISKQITTIEYIEKLKKNKEKLKELSSSKNCASGSKISYFKKLKLILGDNIFLWFLPYDGNRFYEGYQHK
jgi:hypothetical protein